MPTAPTREPNSNCMQHNANFFQIENERNVGLQMLVVAGLMCFQIAAFNLRCFAQDAWGVGPARISC